MDFKNLKAFKNGKVIDFADANVSIANTTFLYGLGVFTGIRAHYNEEHKSVYLFRVKDHFERFKNSCRVARMKGFEENFTLEKFEETIVNLVKENKIQQDVYCRITQYLDATELGPKLGFYPDDTAIFLYPLGDYVPSDGMRCKVSSWTRLIDNSIPARLKANGAYVNTALTKHEALMDGYDEAILLDQNGHAVEGSAENLYIVRDGKIVTPPTSNDILEGITRKSVLEIAENEGFEVVEREIDRTELYFAEEVFLSGTAARVSPVIEIDKLKVGDGKIGPIAGKLQEVYNKAVRGNDEKYMHWLTKIEV